MAFEDIFRKAYSDPSLTRLQRRNSRSPSRINYTPFYTADVDEEYDSDSQDGTCVVSKMTDNAILPDMAGFLKQKMVIGSLWECRAFTADGPDAIMFLTFSLAGARKNGRMGEDACEESTMW